MCDGMTMGELLEEIIFAEAKTSDNPIADWLGMAFTADIETDGSDWEDAANG